MHVWRRRGKRRKEEKKEGLNFKTNGHMDTHGHTWTGVEVMGIGYMQYCASAHSVAAPHRNPPLAMGSASGEVNGPVGTVPLTVRLKPIRAHDPSVVQHEPAKGL